MKTIPRLKIEHLRDHIFLEDKERQQLTEIDARRSNNSVTDDDVLFVAQLETDLVHRESKPDMVTKQIKQFGAPVEDITHELDISVEKEQRAQHQLANILLVSFIFCCFAVVWVIYTLVANKISSSIELGSFFVATFGLVFIAYVLSRLFQSTREASERMDEKSIGLKFIKIGLFYLSEHGNPVLFEKGMEMFLSHHAIKSKPLTDKAFAQFSDGIQGLKDVHKRQIH